MKIIPQQVGHKGSFCNNRVFNKAIRQPNSFKGNTDTRFYPHLFIYPEKIKNWKMEIIPMLARSTAMLSVPQGITCMIN